MPLKPIVEPLFYDLWSRLRVKQQAPFWVEECNTVVHFSFRRRRVEMKACSFRNPRMSSGKLLANETYKWQHVTFSQCYFEADQADMWNH
jgi:hypothetical protein